MRSRSSRPSRIVEVGQVKTTSASRVALILALPVVSLILPALAVAVASAGGHSVLTRAAAGVSRFLLFYSGVFALVALSAAVAAGLLATNRIVLTPERRILAQALHRTMSAVGIAALANHIMLEILAHRARIIDGFVPFMAARRTFYMGLGTLASDLFIVILVTGLLRRKFSHGSGRTVWRVLHATAYVAWPMAIVHGLLAGRSAKPYVDWSYGACLAAVALALTVRYIAIHRGRNARPLSPASAGPADPAAIAGRLATRAFREPYPPDSVPAGWQRALPGTGRQDWPAGWDR
jgi:hypothetical protein